MNSAKARPQTQDPLHGIYRTQHSGVVDADGHILEPPNLWQDYLEAKYQDRALIIETDTADDACAEAARD